MPSDKKALAMGSGLRVGHRVAHVLVALFLTPFIIHTLGAEDFGLWALAAAFLGYYGMMDLGIGAAVARQVAAALGKKNEDGANAYISTAVGLYLVIGTVLLLVTLLAAWLAWQYDYHGRGALFAQIILMVGGLHSVGMPMNVFAGALTAKLRYDLLTSFQFVTLILQSVLIVAVLLAGYGILGMAYVMLACGLLNLAMPYLAVRKVMPFVRIRWSLVSREVRRTLLNYSVFIFLSSTSRVVRFRIDVVVIAEFIGLVATAYYQVAAMLIKQFRYGMDAIFGVLFPYFGKLSGSVANREKMFRVFEFMMRRAIQATFFAATAMIIWGRDFIEVWVGPEFTAAYPCVVALAVAEIITGSQIPAYHFLGGIAKHKFHAYVNIVEAVCNLALSILLVTLTDLGILGVALGTAIPLAVFQGIVMPIYFTKQIGIPLAQYFYNWARTLAICAFVLSPSIVYAWFYSEPTIPSLVGQGIVAVPLYVIGLWLIERPRGQADLAVGPIRWLLSPPAGL
ncbi:MAG: oligosaccharide flippase family protein [Phycisphaeraceae bacterium]|nr:oligosaccharide flippase family protein [Phycisphaeraceae bacterium]